MQNIDSDHSTVDNMGDKRDGVFYGDTQGHTHKAHEDTVGDIILKNVSVVLRRGNDLVSALIDVTGRFHRDEWVALIGNNGSGKSTLARVVAGLMEISKGELSRPEGLRIVLQNPEAQIVGETVWEDLVFGMDLAHVPEEEMVSLGRESLDRVGLDVPVDTAVRHLSGGQKQLLCIASALATRSRWLVFDEVTASLNPLARQRILSVAQRLHQSGVGILWITQLPEELVHANRVLALEGGQVAYDGDVPFFLYTRCERMGYTPPAVVQVVQSLERNGVFIKERPVHVTELSLLLGKEHEQSMKQPVGRPPVPSSGAISPTREKGANQFEHQLPKRDHSFN